MINRFNLKLNDINKEIEYNSSAISNRQIENYIVLIWTSITLYTAVAGFKVLNAFIERNQEDDEDIVEVTMKSNTAGNKIQSIYWEIIEIVMSLTAIYTILKVKSIRSDYVIYALILFQSSMVNIYFVFDP